MATEVIFKQHIAELRAENEKLRQASAQKKKDYYEGRMLDYADELLRTRFSKPERVRPEFEYFNLVAKIMNRKSKVLKTGFTIHAEQGIANDVINSIGVVAKMKQSELYSNLLGMVAHRFFFDGTELKSEMITPNRFWVITDNSDSMKMSTFIWKRENYTEFLIDEVTHYAYDDTYFYILDTNFEVIKQEEHGYGTIPVVLVYSSTPVDNIYIESDDDLALSTDNLAVWLTSLNYLEKYQSFSQPVGKGLPPSTDIFSDPSTIINIPFLPSADRFGEFGFVTPGTNLSDVWSVLKEKVAMVANRYSVPIGDIGKTNANQKSGVALEWENVEAKEDREDSRELWRVNILKFARMALSITKVSNELIDPATDIKVDFAEPRMVTDTEKDNDSWLVRISQGVANKAQWVMELNPDIKTVEEALKVLEYNKAINTGGIGGNNGQL